MNEAQLRARLDSLLQNRQQQHQQLANLRSQTEELQQQAQQVANNINAFNGAIQECEHWLDELDKPPQPAPVTLVPAPGQEDGLGETVVPIPVLEEEIPPPGPETDDQ